MNIYTVETYGAIADYAQIHDAAITSGLKVVTSPSGPFTAADIGKLVLIESAGSAGSVLFSKVDSFTSPTQIVLHDAAVSTVTGARLQYATDSTPAIQTALNLAKATGGDVCFGSSGMYGVTHLDATNPTRSFRLLGVGPLYWGTRLVPMANGGSVIDCTGHDAFVMKNVNIGNGSAQIAMPNFGILMAPSTVVTGMDVPLFEECFIDGVFLTAAAYFDRIFAGTIQNCSMINYWQHGAPGTSFTAVFTGQNILGATSAFATISAGASGISGWKCDATEFHSLDAGGGAGVANTLYLDKMSDSVWIGGLVAGGYTSPVTFGFGCVGLSWIGTVFSFDMPAGYPYVFSGQAPDYTALINCNPTYHTALHSMPMTNLTIIGRS